MNKITILVLLSLCSSNILAQNTLKISEQKKDQIAIIDFLIQRIAGNMPVYILKELGGKSFNTNLACRNEKGISKILNDSLGLSTSPDNFKNLGASLEIDNSFISNSKHVRLINFIDAKEIKQPILKISKPHFFENNQYCLVSYEMGAIIDGNIVLIKVNGKWTERLVICESYILY